MSQQYSDEDLKRIADAAGCSLEAARARLASAGGSVEAALAQARTPQARSKASRYAILVIAVGVIAVGIALVAVFMTPEHSGDLPPAVGEVEGGSLALDTRAFSLEPGHTYTASGCVPVLAELEPSPGSDANTPTITEVPAGGEFTVVDTAQRSGGETLYSVTVSDGGTTVEGWIHPVSLMAMEITEVEPTR
jgi:hypothetical protein